MFGDHFKYVLVLGILAVFTYTSPTVINSISDGIAYTNQQAAIWDVFFAHTRNAALQNNNEDRPRPVFQASTTGMIPPYASSTWATSSRQVGDRPNMGDSQERPDHRIVAQDVVTALFKAGIISTDKLDQARKIAATFEMSSSTPTQFASTTMGRIIREDVRSHMAPTGTSSMPYPPMMDGEGETGQ